MDPVSLAYYALICGALAVVAPALNTIFKRLALGIAIGLIAAASLPALRGLFY